MDALVPGWRDARSPPVQGGPPARTARIRASDHPAPAIVLPKGGGAIRGIGETFTANPITGTASLTIPIPMNPGRSGFGP